MNHLKLLFIKKNISFYLIKYFGVEKTKLQLPQMVFFVLFFFSSNLLLGQNCNCTDYLYVNDEANDIVHKFPINADGSLGPEIGNPYWLQTDVVNSPHGLGVDLNGNLYINRNIGTPSLPNPGLVKISCDGTILDTEVQDLSIGSTDLLFWAGIFNVASIGNSLFTIALGWTGSSYENYFVELDLCTGEIINEFPMPEDDFGAYWGLRENPNGGFYIHNGGFVPANGEDLIIYSIDAGLTTLTTVLTVDTNNGSEDWYYLGIDVDEFGNFYAVGNNITANPVETYLFKISPTGVIIDQEVDAFNGDGGFEFTYGLEYKNGFIYLASTETCVFVLDAGGQNGGLTPLPAFTVPGTSDDFPKAIGSNTECCPDPAEQTITLSECTTVAEKLFLNELFLCEGIVCEGSWIPLDAASTAVYDSCDESISPVSGSGCYNYSKTSTQSGNKQCPSFNVTLEICYSLISAPAISFTDNDCASETNGAFIVDTPCGTNNTLEWSIDGGNTWATTAPAYDTNPLTVQVRCVSDIDNTCIEEGNTVTTAPEKCCPPENCVSKFGEFTIIKRIP